MEIKESDPRKWWYTRDWLTKRLQVEFKEGQLTKETMAEFLTPFQHPLIPLLINFIDSCHHLYPKGELPNFDCSLFADKLMSALEANKEEAAQDLKKLPYEAPLTEEEASRIEQLIEILAASSLIELGRRREELDALGKSFDHLHPLTVWKHLLMDPKLKSYVSTLKKSWSSAPVWKHFKTEYAYKLQAECEAGNLTEEDLKNFLTSLGLTQLNCQADSQTDWVAFINDIVG